MSRVWTPSRIQSRRCDIPTGATGGVADATVMGATEARVTSFTTRWLILEVSVGWLFPAGMLTLTGPRGDPSVDWPESANYVYVYNPPFELDSWAYL